jgi:RHS repeat-associated protein
MKNLLILLIFIPMLTIAQKKATTKNGSKTYTKTRITIQKNSNKLLADQFAYDAVGNVTKDLTQNIASITYYGISKMERDPYVNQLLPTTYYVPKQITFTDGRKFISVYDANGTKLSARMEVNGSVAFSYDYVGPFTYITIGSAPAKLLEIKHEEGRAIPDPANPGRFIYEYDILDHTGSPRVTFRQNSSTGSAEIVRSQDYDPWGVVLKGIDYQNPNSDTLQRKYYFNGKEYLVTFGLTLYDYGKRLYNPYIGRFYQVDPKASLMPSWSPYSFSFDNPVRYRDYDGQIPYPITVRSFAPFSSFGYGFHGDDRGYSTSSSVTARAHQQLNFDTDRNYLTGSAWSSPTWHNIAPSFQRTATPDFGISSFSSGSSGNSKSFTFSTRSAAANPLTPEGATPDIDVFSNFKVVATKSSLSISGSLTGDNFPSTEAFITDPKGNRVFLGIGQIAQGVDRNTGPFTELPGDNKNNPITNFNLSISTDRRGNFTGITSGGQNYSIEDWNKRFTNSSPTR